MCGYVLNQWQCKDRVVEWLPCSASRTYHPWLVFWTISSDALAGRVTKLVTFQLPTGYLLESLKMFWVTFCHFGQKNCLKALKKSQDLLKSLHWFSTPSSNSMFGSSFVPRLSQTFNSADAICLFPLDSMTISGPSVVAVITEKQHTVPWCTWGCWSYAWVQPSPGLRSRFRLLPNLNKRVLCKVLLLAGDDPGTDGICYRLQKLLMKPITPSSLRVGRQVSPPGPQVNRLKGLSRMSQSYSHCSCTHQSSVQQWASTWSMYPDCQPYCCSEVLPFNHDLSVSLVLTVRRCKDGGNPVPA